MIRKFFSSVLLLIVPGLLGLLFIGNIERDFVSGQRKTEDSEIREILGRIHVQGNIQKRFNSLFDQLCQVPCTIEGFAAKSAGLMKEYRNVLDIYLFDVQGRRVSMPGFPDAMVFASQQFMQVLKTPEKKIQEKLVNAFAGNGEVPRRLSETPGALIDLMNGDQKTWGGWWKLRDSRGSHSGDVVVFLHRQGISGDLLLDRAVGEALRKIGEKYWIGWYDPLNRAVLRPRDIDFPLALKEAVSNLPIGKTAGIANDLSFAVFPAPTGEVLFGYLKTAPGDHVYFLRLRLAFLFALAVCSWFLSRALRGTQSLRTRMVLQFAIGGGFPLLVFLATVYVDKEDRELLLVRKIREEHLRHLMKLDGEMESLYFPLLKKYNRLFAEISRGDLARVASMGLEIKKIISEQKGFVTQFAVVNQKGQILFFDKHQAGHPIDRGKEGLPSRDGGVPGAPQPANRPDGDALAGREFLPIFGLNILEAVNLQSVSTATAVLKNPIMEMVVQTKSSRMWLDEDGRFQGSTVGKEYVLTFFRLIQGIDSKFQGIFIATHNKRLGQVAYLRKLSEQWPRKEKDYPLVLAIPALPGSKLPAFPRDSMRENNELRKLRDLVLTTDLPQHQTMWFGRKKFLVSAIKGQLLDEYVIMLARPYSAVQAQAQDLARRAGFIAVLILLLAAGIAWLTARFLLVPISDLEKGLLALKKREFSTVIEPGYVRELALVAGHFNMVLEEFRELQIAKAVQENLWPGKGITGPNWEIAGNCVTATNIGGDHHEWFCLPDGRLVVAVGDVAGHGIPAGLIVASVKIALALGVEKQEDPAGILAYLDTCLKEQLGKGRPMTFWLGILDPNSGLIRFSSAGACYPIAITGDEDARLIEIHGYPLGSRRKPVFNSDTIDMSRGGRLLIYTDGFPEAKTPAGAPFGFERLVGIAKETCRISPEETVNFIFGRVMRWSGLPVPEDDSTLVVLDVMQIPRGIPSAQIYPTKGDTS